MGIISKLFGRGKKLDENSKAHLDPATMAEIRAILVQRKKHEDARAAEIDKSPVFALACAILETSDWCTKQLDSSIKFPTENERRHYAVFVSFAFAVFFCHMTLRTTFRKFGPAARDKVLKALGPVLIGATAKNWTGSEEALAKWRSRLSPVAQGWEIEYARCVEFISDPALEEEFTGNSILATFARNVLELSGYKVPVTDEHTGSWAAADFVAAGKTRCRYSSDAHLPAPFTILRLQRLAITGLEALSLSDYIEKVMSQ